MDLEDNYNSLYPECFICLEPIRTNSIANMKLLNSCSHEFHKKCLNKWIKSKHNKKGMECPICSEPFKIYDGNMIKIKKTKKWFCTIQ